MRYRVKVLVRMYRCCKSATVFAYNTSRGLHKLVIKTRREKVVFCQHRQYLDHCLSLSFFIFMAPCHFRQLECNTYVSGVLVLVMLFFFLFFFTETVVQEIDDLTIWVRCSL